MKLPAYPSYKSSGVEWLGDVPEHWEVTRLKNAATYRVSSVDKVPAEVELPVRLCNYTDVYYNERINPEMPFMETTASRDEIERFRLLKDDVLITKDSEDWADIAIPALVEETSDDLVCGYHLAIVRPDGQTLTGPFLLRAFQASAVNQQFQLAASGVTRYGLPKSAIGDALLALAPLGEQRAIAAFLDTETAKLDTLIEKKRAFIELLREQRAALISRTVTRGLPPDAALAAGLNREPKLKDSGVEWLREVPEHWEIGPVKRTWNACDYGTSDSLTGDGAIRVLTMGNIQDGRVILPEAGCLDVIDPYLLLRKDDLLFNRTNSLIHVGKVGHYDYDEDEVTFASYLVRIRVRDGMSPRFWSYALNVPSLLSFVRSQALPSINQANLNPTRYGQVQVAVPPAAEQHVIADYLDDETAKIDQMSAKVEEAIERLREYRSALITAAVTGKIDVRQAVA